eukprot:3015963-Ditylum_brightwellii.AAC.1
MFRQVLEVRNPGFKSQMGVVEGGICCSAFHDRVVMGWVNLDTDGTMKKGCKSLLWNPMAGYKNMPGGHTKC